MVFSLGLPPRIDAQCKYSVVFYFEFTGDCALFIRHGSNDFIAHTAQRYCQIQPGE